MILYEFFLENQGKIMDFHEFPMILGNLGNGPNTPKSYVQA